MELLIKPSEGDTRKTSAEEFILKQFLGYYFESFYFKKNGLQSFR